MSDIECPYCGEDCGMPDEDSGEGELQEWECHNCNKNFVYYCQYSVDYYSNKAPCLNGGKHEWESICGAPAEFFENKYRCKYCDEEETILPGDKDV